MTYFDSNLAILTRNQPDLARALHECPMGSVTILPARSGNPTLSYRPSNSESVFLHSKYDPVREADQFISSADPGDADYIIFLGFGLGYGLDALMKRAPKKETHIFIVESNLQILRAALEARDMREVLSLPNIHIAWPPTAQALDSQWADFFDPVTAKKNAFIRHPPAYSLDTNLFDSAVECIQSKTLQIFTDINTLIGTSQSFLNNFIANLPLVLQAAGISTLKNQFDQIPAVIVSAGPSLDRNIQDLRAVGDRALILASDTVIKPLLNAGIHPHFVLSGDPSYENYLHLKNAPAEKTYLVADPTAFPKTLESFENRILICTFESSAIHGLSSLLSPKGILRAWGSVATMCLDFALHLGCNPIIFTGQDLAHSDGRAYCAGLYWEEKHFCSIQNPNEWKEWWNRNRAAKKTVLTKDIFGRPAESTDRLMSYWNWFAGELEKHPEKRFVNATEGGILRKNVEILNLRHTLHRYCNRNLNLRARTEKIIHEATARPLEPDTSTITRLMRESADLRTPLNRGVRLCRYGLQQGGNGLQAELEKVRGSIYRQKSLAPLLDSFNQMGNYHFLRRTAVLRKEGKKAKISDIKEAYLEFFQSIQKASRILDDAMIKIRSILIKQGFPITS